MADKTCTCCACEHPGEEHHEHREESKYKITLPIADLHCSDCALSLEQFLKHLPGIISADVSYVHKNVVIRYNPDQIDVEKIKKALNRPGYIIKETPLEKTKGFFTRNKDYISTIIGGVLLLFSWIVSWMGMDPLYSSIFALLATVLAGYRIFIHCFRSLMVFSFNVNVLVGLAAIGAVILGAYKEAATVIFIMVLGESLESLTVAKMHRSITELMKVLPTKATLIRESGKKSTLKKPKEISVDDIKKRDVLLVKTGEKIPIDGKVIKGESYVNQAVITGESEPALKKIGSEVYAGTVNDSGILEISATKIGEDTMISRIKHLVEEAQRGKAPIQRIVDKYARYFIPLVLITALTVFIITKDAFRAITILVVACPCALVLGTPTAIIAGIGKAAKRGVLIKGGQYLESAGGIDVVMMDKTGTLTLGKPVVNDIISFKKYKKSDVIKTAAMLECKACHPISDAILTKAQDMKINVSSSPDIDVFKGKGIVTSNGKQKKGIGNIALMEQIGVTVSKEIKDQMSVLEEKSGSAILVSKGKDLMGMLSVSDALREDAKDFISSLEKLGLKTVMLTGDSEVAAERIARLVGISDYHASLLPDQKMTHIKEMQKDGFQVAFIGDGINDAPALAQADVGISMGSGTSIAMEVSDVVLMEDEFKKLSSALKISRKALSVIKQNIFFAIFFNVILVGLSSRGLVPMMLGAILHQVSSLVVIGNSMKLLFTKK